MSSAFRYRAATATGEMVEGVLQADDVRAATDELRRQTLVPVSVEPGVATVATRWQLRGSQADAVATSLRTLAALAGGGATLDRSLDFAARHAEHPQVASALADVRRDVQGGLPLAAALRARTAVFGTLAPAMVRAGEESGTLDETLSRLADHLERARELRAQVRGALIYPALLAVVAGLGVMVLLGVVVPRFVTMLAGTGGALPLSTRILMGASRALTGGWWAWLLVLVLGLSGVVLMRRDLAWRERWHAWRLRLPIAGALETRLWTSRFTRALGVLLRAGTPMLTALRVARESVDNTALGARLEAVVARVQRGDRLAASLEDVLPPLATQLLAVGEESGSLDAMATRVADTFDAEVQRGLRTLAGLLEPALIVLFGGLVGFVALAMLQAIYSVNANVL